MWIKGFPSLLQRLVEVVWRLILNSISIWSHVPDVLGARLLSIAKKRAIYIPSNRQLYPNTCMWIGSFLSKSKKWSSKRTFACTITQAPISTQTHQPRFSLFGSNASNPLLRHINNHTSFSLSLYSLNEMKHQNRALYKLTRCTRFSS